MPPIVYRGFAVAPITLRPLLKKLARFPPSPVSPPQRPPSSREGDRPQAVEGVPTHRAPLSPLRAPSRSLLYNPGCRVATLLVSMGVMGFLGDSRGRNSKSPPNPLGLAERVLRTSPQRPPSSREGDRPQAVEGVSRPSPMEKFPFSTSPGSPVGQALRPCRRLPIGALRSPLSPFAPSRRYFPVPRPPPQRPPSSREGDRPQAVEGVPRPSPVKKFPFSTPPGSPVGQALRPCRRLHIGALRSPLLPFAPLKET